MKPGWEVRVSDPRRERRRRWLLLLLVFAIPAAFALGWYWPQAQPQQTSEDTQALLTRVAEQDQELELLRQRLAVVGSSDKVTQQAMEQNRRTIKLLEEQIFKQQQDLAFYKGVLAPASRREGMRIRAFELQATEQPRRFRYKLLMSRVGASDEALQGRMRITIEGQQKGKPATLDLATLSDEVSDSSIPFSFKHFQSFPEAGRFGELQLPEGFEPRQVKVQAEVEGDKPLSRTFEWIKSGATIPHVE
ncbi:DUF6776 family protein [Pseudomonas sp. UBA6323]|uniref:DUF6776 family protein n=1 Tax=Pseudomonas sp. UBA6323 TaxID=1947329 RepID=UPI0025D7250F|nr:DUF6776 family protein [Pseudomonas sp. UBA6323]